MNLQRHQKGFTLLEILIAMGIVGIIIMVMGSIFIGATKLWLSSDVHMQAQQQARDMLSGNPHLKVIARAEFVEWQGILNELQTMCLLLPANPGGTQTLASNKIRFATEAYIQDGGNGVCNSVPKTILYGTRSISDIQIGTSGAGSIFIIHGEDGKFRSSPGGDDILYGQTINNDGILLGPAGTITTSDRYIVGDVISYRFNSGSRTITRIVNDTTETIMGTDISDFSLSYYDAANGTVTDNGTATDLSSVKQIQGTLTVAVPKKAGSAYATYTLTFKVNPRKLDSAFGRM
ncbi:type II secretion system protein [Candidatus Desantisbacteria bacterium]|nr:type II secretion system protein [Candidatus Desantisbacteria bacterium]